MKTIAGWGHLDLLPLGLRRASKTMGLSGEVYLVRFAGDLDMQETSRYRYLVYVVRFIHAFSPETRSTG
jgi:hypothetical protein